MLAYWGELDLTPHTVNSSSNTPRVTSCFSKQRLTMTLSWGAGEGSWETGESSSGFVPLLPWGMGTGKKKKIAGYWFPDLGGKIILQPQAPQRASWFLLFAGTVPGSVFLSSDAEAGPASSPRHTWQYWRHSDLFLLTGPLPENTHILQPVWGSGEAGSASVFYVERLLK